ncbi:zinc-binding alcohol dehydrogenase family protein [Christiangramia forsetii]|uniref:Zinc-type alcohol dehydrogenase-like protein n=2 Tax=Christiangramia forsetii TaxID=411153 RepID=A0M1Q2_CHRFK|nr:zinc-binding alcohol dehydrogenase family protein [Christiangramia forsetii]GGG41966.1 NADPH:quinone reductase [Christiangramia forsetii]CAL66547.1 zinc-type alcohol dehydrogenase [Christiangramia forsetii KT0803]
MKAVGFKKSLSIEKENSFIDFEIDKPKPQKRDLLVKIKAISVNPVDYKVRQSAAKDSELDNPKIIGWDASGVVEAVGDDVEMFKVGDEVYYSGDLTRPGCYSEFQLVDERIVGYKPDNLNWEEAAALPLTSLTAWESIFDRLRIKENEGKAKTVLIIGGAGGVGSIAIQILKQLTNFKVIATASRDITKKWCEKMGADKIVDHHNLMDSMGDTRNVDYILNFADTSGNWKAMTELIAPQGGICCIVNTTENVDLNLMKEKSVSFHWELMFTRSMFKTDDMIMQHEILNKVRKLIEANKIKTTLNETFEGLSAETLKKVHKLQESGKSVGKNVISF